ncbi:unnamed protein product [Polarella glacialis]|uniref:Uncharacterized protein n=1 Tax=Polarella glacialis TaxID=89957 RepID=A0A813IYQ2_POLGL|nr:unnamed protein product [Polarella glacialis]
MLESKGFLFKADEPDGRGIFAVDALAAAVLVNNGSHVQILVNQDGTSQEASSLLLESFRSALEGALHQDGHAMIAQGTSPKTLLRCKDDPWLVELAITSKKFSVKVAPLLQAHRVSCYAPIYFEAL